MTLELVFETHSITVDNETGHAMGWLPGELSTRGRELALELGVRRRADGLDAVFTSDRHRAVETAEIAFAGSGIPVFADARLRECDYGELNGRPREEVHLDRPPDEPFPGGESWREAVGRVLGFLEELVRTRDGQRVLVIGHMATRYAVECAGTGATLEDVLAQPFAWQPGWSYRLSASSSPTWATTSTATAIRSGENASSA